LKWARRGENRNATGKDSSERRKNEVRGIPIYEEKVGFFTKTTEKKGTADRQESMARIT